MRKAPWLLLGVSLFILGCIGCCGLGGPSDSTQGIVETLTKPGDPQPQFAKGGEEFTFGSFTMSFGQPFRGPVNYAAFAGKHRNQFQNSKALWVPFRYRNETPMLKTLPIIRANNRELFDASGGRSTPNASMTADASQQLGLETKSIKGTKVPPGEWVDEVWVFLTDNEVQSPLNIHMRIGATRTAPLTGLQEKYTQSRVVIELQEPLAEPPMPIDAQTFEEAGGIYVRPRPRGRTRSQ